MNTLKKGVFILPNFLTSLSLFCGFYAVIATMQGNYVFGAWAIVIASVFDGLDGRIARMTNTTSKFGVEYDSLSDLVAFGVAPAVLAFGWVLQQYGRLGWLAAFLYVACGAMRLARFNVLAGTTTNKYFQGLPIPAAAGMVASTIIFCFHFQVADKQLLSIFLLLIIYAMAFLMVSTMRFQSFKDLDLGSRKPFNAVVAVILLIIVFAMEPQVMLFAIALLYVLSGPAGYIIYLARKKKRNEIQSVTAGERDECHESKN
ncbi:CDP-diacylglycerol--serine O-phosphatidyltransferase [Thermodesulfobacteriota bacterium]